MAGRGAPSRREFLAVSAGLSGGILLGFRVPSVAATAGGPTAAPGAEAEFAPNAFIRISKRNVVTIVVHKAEMGQGIYTSLPMLIAEELEVDLRKVRVVAAPVDPAYNHPTFGMQFTGGSQSVTSEWERLRQAGAVAREMLLQAAAETWRLDRTRLRAEDGRVFAPDGRVLTYGQLVDKARTLPVPKDVPLKDPSQFKIIGRATPRLDSRDKVTGTAIFGIDVRVPGMLTAVVARSPVFGGTVKDVRDAKARAIPGVRRVVQIPSGVAVVATSFWAARRGRDALEITWNEGDGATVDTTAMRATYATLAGMPGRSARREGSVEPALAGAARQLAADYEMPYLAHAPMEPLNCLVRLTGDRCEIWTGTQFQGMDRLNAAKAAGVPPERVDIHTTFLGGGFGRRATPTSDFVVEAVHLSLIHI